MFGSNMFAQPMFAQSFATVTQAGVQVLNAVTRGIVGFFRTTRRLF